MCNTLVCSAAFLACYACNVFLLRNGKSIFVERATAGGDVGAGWQSRSSKFLKWPSRFYKRGEEHSSFTCRWWSQAMKYSSGKSERKPMTRHELKSVPYLTYLVRKLSKAEHIICDAFSRTLYTAKAFSCIDKNLRLIRCDNDVVNLENSIPSLLKMYASELVNSKSDLTWDEELMNAVWVSWLQYVFNGWQ